MENKKELKINIDHLEELIRMSSTTTVGEVMKRFESIEDKTILKIQVKELLYEQFRNFKTLLIAYGLGKESIKLEFRK
jgi:hypothetical protein